MSHNVHIISIEVKQRTLGLHNQQSETGWGDLNEKVPKEGREDNRRLLRWKLPSIINIQRESAT